MKEQNGNDYITLKWGTLKSWHLHSEKGQKLLKEYLELGSSFGVAQQEDSPEQKELICKMIDECSVDEIYLDWDGKYVSKEEAKKYVLDYGKD